MKKLGFLVLIAAVAFGYSAFLYADDAVRVISFAGDVKITPRGEEAALPCKPDMMLKTGDRVVTGEESYLEAAFGKARQNSVKIEQNSNAVIMPTGDDRIELVDGELVAVLNSMKKGEVFRVRTPFAVCGARGTAWVTDVVNDTAVISSLESKVFVRGIGSDGKVMEKEYWVNEGFERRVKEFERPERMLKISGDRLKKLQQKVSPSMDGGRISSRLKAAGTAITPTIRPVLEPATTTEEPVVEERTLDTSLEDRFIEPDTTLERVDRIDKIEKIDDREKLLDKSQDVFDTRRDSIIEQKEDIRLDDIREDLKDDTIIDKKNNLRSIRQLD